jgi:tetratricopeptide (TPR) repeat protein
LIFWAEPVKVKVNVDSQSANAVVVKSMDVKFLTPVNYGVQRPKFQFLLLPPAKVEHFPIVKDPASISAFQMQYVTTGETGSSKNVHLTPWFDEYRAKFFRTLGPSAFEQFEHPVVCLIMTTSLDINPVDTLQRLFDKRASGVQNGLPRYLDTGAMMFHYVLLHDASNGKVTYEEAVKKYAAVEKLWPGLTSIVTVNSLASPEVCEDFADSRKTLLSTADMDSFKRLIRTLVWNTMLPHMERSVQSIFPEVSKERGGLMHKINLMWGSKFSRKSDDNDPDGLLFEVNSLEFRERRLADWAFMLGEYTVAYKTYMSLADIYKNDGATVPIAVVYRASALEMAANCLCQLGANNANLATPQQWAEIDKLFAESWDLYQRGRRRTWARRSALSHAYWAQFRLQASSVTALERLIGDSSDQLELALLHQQQAISQILRNPSRIRNFAFGLVKAADAFTLGHQFLHSMCCYYTAQCVYEDKQWTSVNDYLHFRLARLALVVQRYDLAMKFISELLKRNRQTPALQNSYLREYLYIFKTFGHQLPPALAASQALPASSAPSSAQSSSSTISTADTSISGLSTLPIAPIPNLDRKVKIHVQDVAGGSPHSSPEWQALESALIEIMTPPEKRYLLTLKKPNLKAEHLGVVGENIYVDVVLTNPLQVPIQFTDMRLCCHLTPSWSAMASGVVRRTSSASKPLERDTSTSTATNDAKIVVQPPSASSSITASSASLASSTSSTSSETAQHPPLWSAESYDKLFGPGETRTVQFAVKPLVEGSLSVLGVQFKICGVMEAFRPLLKPSVIKIAVPMPRVELLLLGLPGSGSASAVGTGTSGSGNLASSTADTHTTPLHPTVSSSATLYVGQHHQTTLRIRNTGQKPLQNLAFSTSHPHVFMSPLLEEDLSLPHKWAARIPLKEPLQPDQWIDVPLTLRASVEGIQSFQILVYYEPQSASGSTSAPSSSSSTSDIKYRLTRATVTLKVVKSLKVNATVRPDPTKIDQYLLAVDIDNLTKLKTKSGAVIAIRSLSITCPKWRPLLIDPSTGEPFKDANTRKLASKFGTTHTANPGAVPSLLAPAPSRDASNDINSASPSPSASPAPSEMSTDSPPGTPTFERIRPTSRTPAPNKLSLHSTTALTSYDESACMRPETMETTLGLSATIATILPPRHATTIMFRLVRKSVEDDDADVANSNIVFSHATNSQADGQASNFAAFLAQESIIARRNATPKRSALFDSRTPEELEEAKRIHDINLSHNISLYVRWELAADSAASTAVSANLSALTLSVPSSSKSSASGGASSGGSKSSSLGAPLLAASHNVFDIPFLPTTPWSGGQVLTSSASTAPSPSTSGSQPPSSTTNAPGSAGIASLSLPLLPHEDLLCPVRVALCFSPTVRHSFGAHAVAFVPVTFQIQNVSPFTSVSLHFEALKPCEHSVVRRNATSSYSKATSSRKNVVHSDEGRSGFMWVGRTSHEISRLDPEAITTFTLQACFPFHGQFNLNRWRFWVSPVHLQTRKVAVYAKAQHFISVINDPNASLARAFDPIPASSVYVAGSPIVPRSVSHLEHTDAIIRDSIAEGTANNSSASIDVVSLSAPSDTSVNVNGIEREDAIPEEEDRDIMVEPTAASVTNGIEDNSLGASVVQDVDLDSLQSRLSDTMSPVFDPEAVSTTQYTSQDLAASLARSTISNSDSILSLQASMLERSSLADSSMSSSSVILTDSALSQTSPTVTSPLKKRLGSEEDSQLVSTSPSSNSTDLTQAVYHPSSTSSDQAPEDLSRAKFEE